MILIFLFVVFINSSQTRPSVLLTSDRLSEIRTKIEDEEEPYFDYFDDIYDYADDLIVESLITYTEFNELSDSGIRTYGKQLVTLCFVYLINDDIAYLNTFIRWMDLFSDFDDWHSNHDFGSATILTGFSLGYDWCYNFIPESNRTIYRDKIKKQCEDMIECLAIDDCGPHLDRYQSNHMHVIVSGFGIGGYTLRQDDLDFSLNVTTKAYDLYTLVLEYINPDGVAAEGEGYWSYSLYMMFQYFQAEHQFMGIDRVSTDEYFKKTLEYRIHTSVPGYSTNQAYFGDMYLSSQGIYVCFRLASKLSSGILQYISEACEHDWSKKATVFNLIWVDQNMYNNKINPATDSSLPLYKYFSDFGLLTTKTSWNGETKGNLVVNFKSNPPCGIRGEQILGKYDGVNSCGHKHPDSGSFHFFYENKFLLLDDGYSYWKRTLDHNLVTFNDGVGQYGENAVWFDKSPYVDENGYAETIFTNLNSNFQYAVANLTRIYPLSINLKKYLRHFVVLKGKFIIVFDDIKFLSNTQQKVNIHFHAPVEGLFDISDPKNVIYDLGDSSVKFKLFNLDDGEHSRVVTTGVNENYIDGTEFVSKIVNISVNNVNEVLFKSVIIPFGVNDSLPVISVSSENNGRFTKFNFDDLTEFSINIDTFEAFVKNDDDIYYDLGYSFLVNLFLLIFCSFLII